MKSTEKLYTDKRLYKGIEEMTQWLGAFAAFPEGLGS